MTYVLAAKRPHVNIPAQRRAFPPVSGPHLWPGTTKLLPTRGYDKEQLNIHIEPRGDYTVVYLIGELDLATHDVTYDTLLDLVIQAGPHLVVDLAGVTFSDAYGISPLLQDRKSTV